MMRARFLRPSLSPSLVASSRPPAPPPTMTIRCSDVAAWSAPGASFSRLPESACFGSGPVACFSSTAATLLRPRAHLDQRLAGDHGRAAHRAHRVEEHELLLADQVAHRDLGVHRVARFHRRLALARLLPVDGARPRQLVRYPRRAYAPAPPAGRRAVAA